VTETTIPMPKKPVGPWRSERIPVEAGLKPGAVHEIPQFLPGIGPMVSTAKVVGPEEIEGLDGAKRALVRMETSMDVFPMKHATWLTPEGDMVQTRLEVSGMVIETLVATKDVAMGVGAKEEAPSDVFLDADSLIKTWHLVPHPRTLETALLHVRFRRADLRLPEFEDERQTIVGREADWLLLRVKRVVPPEGATGKRPLAAPPAEMARYLGSSSMLQTDDPLIRKTAEEAVAGETDAWKAAQAIERWVFHGIAKKNFGVGFASALEVCRDREGDCSEHSVLLAALCRAAGIPSRVVMGTVYLTGIFGGHAWTEVWIEGRWYALDATLGHGFVDPVHITFGRLAMEEGTYAREFGSFMDALGGLDVQVREATWEGRTMRFDDPAAVKVEGTRYVNRPWGLSVRGPGGFAVRPRGPAEGLSQRLVDLEGKTPAGKTRTIRVRAESLGVGDDLAGAAKTYSGGVTFSETQVDGRKALVGDAGEGAKRQRLAFVVDDRDSLFAFQMDLFEDGDAALFGSFLETVDLDAEQPAR
jgi:transglutaminase-like putative cysteine protease